VSGGLSRTETDRLREVVSSRSPPSLWLLDALLERPLTHDEREELRHIVMDDFLERGLGEDDEPNAYGHQMERLIDVLGHQ
jgi:hypothetical protein